MDINLLAISRELLSHLSFFSPSNIFLNESRGLLGEDIKRYDMPGFNGIKTLEVSLLNDIQVFKHFPLLLENFGLSPPHFGLHFAKKKVSANSSNKQNNNNNKWQSVIKEKLLAATDF